MEGPGEHKGAFLWEEWPTSDPAMRECRAGLRNRSCPQGYGDRCGKGGIQVMLEKMAEPESDVCGGLGKSQTNGQMVSVSEVEKMKGTHPLKSSAILIFRLESLFLVQTLP